MKKAQIIGYTTGVFDLFHIGHLNMLINAKALCDKLIVGVSTDELVIEYKNKTPIIAFGERKRIVENIKCVDAVVPQRDMNKLEMCKKLGVSVLIVGDDWYGTDKWNDFEKQLKEEGIDIIYFPYTNGTSSTLLREVLHSSNKEERDEKR